MPQYNPDKIIKLVSELRKGLDRLKELKTLDKETFLSDPDKIGSANTILLLLLNRLSISATTSFSWSRFFEA